MNHIFSGMDILMRDLLMGLGAFVVFLIFWWIFRIIRLVEFFLKAAIEVLGGAYVNKTHMGPFYSKNEVKGNYKGREVFVGVLFSGFRGEFLPMPHIQMRLREVIGYNTNRLPHYAVIEKNLLVYKAELSVLWGVFDKHFPHVFGIEFLLVALEQLLATAEDVERGRTIKEVWK